MIFLNLVVVFGNKYLIGNKMYIILNGFLIFVNFKVGDEIIGVVS